MFGIAAPLIGLVGITLQGAIYDLGGPQLRRSATASLERFDRTPGSILVARRSPRR